MEANPFPKPRDSRRDARSGPHGVSGESTGLSIPLPGFAELLERPWAAQQGVRDATQQLEFAHQRVELERQRYQDLFEFAPDGYLITDLRGIVRQCNRAAATLLDQPIQNLVGKPLARFIAPEDRSLYRHRLPFLQRLERAGEWELTLKKPGRAAVHARVTVAVARDQEGNPVELRWLLRDVTRRKQMETQLAESEARHRFLTEHAQDAIYLFRFGPELHLDYVSPAVSKITGYAPEDFYRDWRLVRELIHSEDLPVLERYLQKAEEMATPVTVRLTHRSGQTVWVEQHAVLVRDSVGRPIAVEAIVRDVTERVQTEAQLERLRTEFLVVLAHEFRTPLTGIKGSAAIGLSPETPPKPREAQELFKIIDEQADRLREIVSNLLDITQIESGILSLYREDVDMASLLEEARDAFVRGGEMHAIVLELPELLPRVKVDKRRMGQVVSNLLSNAARVSPAAEPIVVSARREEGDVLVQVSDHGRGIPNEKLPFIFRKFYKVDEVTDKGTGLGLAISKGIVEAHGGRIWAESEGEGHGATITFALPLAA
jgi:PAS domain S-box-containing protein